MTEPCVREKYSNHFDLQIPAVWFFISYDRFCLINIESLFVSSVENMAPCPIINSVSPLHVGQFLFVRIETDNGVVGWGESGVWGHIEAGATAVTRFGEYLVGKPAFAIEHHWNVMHRFSYFQGTAINAAISGIDIALWDIKGKVLGVPVWELLGGRCRDKARIYGHIYERTIEGVLAECRKKMDLGYNAFGHINPFLDEGHDQVYFKTHVQKMQDAADNVRRMREVVGDKVDLLIELHRRLTPAEAITFANMIKEYRPMFVDRSAPKVPTRWLESLTALPFPSPPASASAQSTSFRPTCLGMLLSTFAWTLRSVAA